MFFINISDLNTRRSDLVALYSSMVLGFILNLSSWFGGKIATTNGYEIICSRFIQNCEKFIFLEGTPTSWNDQIFHFIIFLFLVFSVYFFIKGKHKKSALLLVPPLIIEGLFGFVLFEQSSIPFIYYHFFPCIIFLFSKNPFNDLKWMIVLLYILAGWVKLDEGWLAGGYFHNLELGLPLISSSLITPISILVTVMELSSGLLLCKIARVKGIYLKFFYIFHLYSFILVGYRYPLLCLPLLYFTFSISQATYRPTKFFNFVASILILFNLLPHLIDSNYKLTDQGNSLALNMFDANRQSFSKMTIHNKNGDKEVIEKNTTHAYDRVKPYHYWFIAKKKCGEGIEKISWELDISLNGGAFWRVVDLEDICLVSFKPLSKNSWIDPKISGKNLPGPNSYFSNRSPIETHQQRLEKQDREILNWVWEKKEILRWIGMSISILILLLIHRSLITSSSISLLVRSMNNKV